MQNAKGTLIPVGGNEDKGLEENEMYTMEFIDEGILYHVVNEAGGLHVVDISNNPSLTTFLYFYCTLREFHIR